MSFAIDFKDLVELGSPLDLEGGLAVMLISDGEGDAPKRGWISRKRKVLVWGVPSLACAASA